MTHKTLSCPVARSAALITLVAGACCGIARAQTTPPDGGDAVAAEGTGAVLRRVDDAGPPTTLAFKDVPVNQVLPFIVEATGKVVMPQPDVLTRKITVLNDQPIARERALDLVFLTLLQAGIGVVETDETISLRDINEIDRQDVPVIPHNVSTLGRTDVGVVAEKVYTLYNNTAEEMEDVLKNSIPSYAKLRVDKESNRVAIMGNIGLLQRIERLLGSIDQPKAGALVTETFLLRYADAEQVKTNIEELFSEESGQGNNNRNQGGGNRNVFFGGQNQGEQSQGTSGAGVKVTANTQQNAVTVVGEPALIEQIRQQVTYFWDKPLSKENVVPKVYDLKYSDPIKMKATLEGLFGTASTATGGANQGGGNRGGNNAGSSAGQGTGRLAGQFSFEAVPTSNRIVVVARSPDNVAVIDQIIAELDRPQTAGLPEIVSLKHASAEELAEQLNALLALEGTLAQIPRSESGLSESSATASPFATDQNANANNQDDGAANASLINFWWQRARTPTDDSGSSNLVGQIRIVPVWRQNALMVLAPVEYKASVVSLIEDLDRPGRQVLIKAIIAEIATDDLTALGVRWSSNAITPTSGENAFGVGIDTANAVNPFLPGLFDTSVLNVNADINLLLQALSEKSDVRILSEPRIFTSDNQEAEFFDGQDIPFVTDSQVTDQGNQIQSFDYRAVGIQLRARPRITVKREVDLRVNVELSSITPGQTLFGGFIVDRRETTTQLILKDGQTVVISGIFRNELTDIVRKVPLLGDIPILGELFRSREKQNRNTELVIFITPQVVDNTDQTDALIEKDVDWLHQQRREHNAPGINPEDDGANDGQ